MSGASISTGLQLPATLHLRFLAKRAFALLSERWRAEASDSPADSSTNPTSHSTSDPASDQASDEASYKASS